MPPEWWREYRRRRGDELRKYNRQRRQQPKLKAQRKDCEARRRRKTACCMDNEPLPTLYPEVRRGTVVSFWEDELRLDLEQEAALAMLEGRCPEAARKAYRTQEMTWRRRTCPMFSDQPEGSGGEGSMD